VDQPFGLRCTRCGEESGATESTCRCGGILALEWDLGRAGRTLTRAALEQRPASMLRYRELLPLAGVEPKLGAIVTPLLEAPRLAAALGVASAAVKVEGMQPTGSLKDRASAIAAARAEALGYEVIACASSGNAATSMAGQATAHGLRATVFVPHRLPEQKLLQLHALGARVVAVDGPYEAAYRLCEDAAPRYGWYNRNCAQNPYLVEGKKTCGLEIAEQGVGRPADWVVVAVGDGCTVAGIWKGLVESHALGLAPGLPRMLGVKPAAGTETIADSIAVAEPRNAARAQAAVESSHGALVAVTDEAIHAATLELPRLSGVFAEPAAAATVAGVRLAREQGIIGGGDRVVLVTTGVGFKNLDVVRAAVEPRPQPVPPTPEALDAWFSGKL
jgi:threonine synthase